MVSHSKVTAQGRFRCPPKSVESSASVPLRVEAESGEQVIVRKAGRHSSEDVHHVLFAGKLVARTLGELKEGIRRHIRKRHARR